MAKLITVGATRDEAISRLVEAIDDTVCFGPANNLGFLRAVVDSAAFRSGELTTHFLDQHFPKGRLPDVPALPVPVHAVAALALADACERAEGETPWSTLGSWRLLGEAGAPASSFWFLQAGKRVHPVRVVGDGTVDWGDGPVEASVRPREDGRLELDAGGRLVALRVARHADRIALVHAGERHEFVSVPREQAWRTAAGGRGAAGRSLVAPFPGQIAEVRAAVGDRVAEGDVLVVLEAMKMLHNLTAGGSAVVAEVACEVGAAVGTGDVLMRFESAEQEGSTK